MGIPLALDRGHDRPGCALALESSPGLGVSCLWLFCPQCGSQDPVASGPYSATSIQTEGKMIAPWDVQDHYRVHSWALPMLRLLSSSLRALVACLRAHKEKG